MGRLINLEPPFRPSTHGFGFPNAWENRLVDVRVGGRPVQLITRGRCGGMSFAALDYFRAGRPLSAEALATALPPTDAPLARYIWRRQLDSFFVGGAHNVRRYLDWTLRPTGGRSGVAALTRRRELGRILVAMLAGNPIPLGLISAEDLRDITENHQVVAYAADRDDDRLLIRIYDSNHPGRDDVTLDVAWAGEEPVVERVGGTATDTWRGLFVERYSAEPPEA